MTRFKSGALLAFVATSFVGCAATQRVPVSMSGSTYLGDTPRESLKLREERVWGSSCDEYIPFINIQTGVGTTDAAMEAALGYDEHAVGLANVTVEVQHKVNGFGVMLYERCIVVSGRPLVPKDAPPPPKRRRTDDD